METKLSERELAVIQEVNTKERKAQDSTSHECRYGHARFSGIHGAVSERIDMGTAPDNVLNHRGEASPTLLSWPLGKPASSPASSRRFSASADRPVNTSRARHLVKPNQISLHSAAKFEVRQCHDQSLKGHAGFTAKARGTPQSPSLHNF